MEWISEWVRNIAFYFIFLSAVMNFLPGSEERKYLRYFMGMILVILLLKPLLQVTGLETKLSQQVLADSLDEEYEELLRESARQEIVGEDYVKNACEREMKGQIGELLLSYGYVVSRCTVTFFDRDSLELNEISLVIKQSLNAEKEHKHVVSSKSEQEKYLKNELEEVYHIPAANINIMIQG
ncbi:MAG: hypothetical protein EOM40_01745 [Clostridia bacterium]|nr:hypothetical protein [Clostridia bacterium]NCC44912.1 hypothetical protein [Clostridia bacterium]